MKVVRLSALRTSRLCPREIFLVLISLTGWVDPSVNFQFVAQCLNHCATMCPTLWIGGWIYLRASVDALEQEKIPMSLLGLKIQIIPVVYLLCHLYCPGSKHSELNSFIYYAFEFGQLSQYSNTLQYGKYGFQTLLGRDFSHSSRLTPRLTQPPLQWVPLLSSRGKVVTLWCWHHAPI
jgi:hypothetical protein